MATTYLPRLLLLLASATLPACGTYDVVDGKWRPFSVLPISGPLEEKCPQQLRIQWQTKDCQEWERHREAAVAEAAEEKRRVEEAARQERRRAAAEQEARERELREREYAAAVQEDERQGYKTLTFNDFALDAKSMLGTRVAVHGFYVARGERLARDPISAIRWIEASHDSSATLLPLLTSSASRDSRALLLRCQESPVGWCPLVAKGRVKTLTMRNRLGVVSQQVGIELESAR